MITFQNVSVSRGLHTILDKTALSFDDAGVTLVVGPSGCGKSSLLCALAGIGHKIGLTVTGQYCQSHDEPVELSAQRPTSSCLVFQNAALYDELSVRENLNLVANRGAEPDVATRQLINRLLDGIDQRQLPSQLSGGQKQRIAVARGLYSGGRLVLMDEPNAGLDLKRSEILVEIVRTLALQGRHVVMALHHPDMFLSIATRVLYLDGKGQLIRLPLDLADISSALGTAQPLPEWANNAGSELQLQRRSHMGWFVEFFGREVWSMTLAPSNLLYIGAACALLAFTTAMVAVTSYPFSDALLDLTLEQLVAELGNANYRYTVPLLVCILVAARSGALVTTDLAMKQFSGSILALDQLGVPIWLYRGTSVALALLVATLVLYVLGLIITIYMVVLAVAMSTSVSASLLLTLVVTDFLPPASWPADWHWVAAKIGLSGLSVGLVSLALGRRYVRSGRDITESASMAVLLSILSVICLHSVTIMMELGLRW